MPASVTPTMASAPQALTEVKSPKSQSLTNGNGPQSAVVAPLTPVEEPEKQTSTDSETRSPKRHSSTVYEKVCAKLSRSGLKNSLSSPSLKKAPLATEDDEDLEDVQVVHLRPSRAQHHNQRRCHSEVTPKKTAELLVNL